MTTVVPEALAALSLPDHESLTARQRRGVVCVWCPMRLTAETAVDLGEQTGDDGRWWPRACGPCVGRRAHRALYTHVALCEPCVDDVGQCQAGLALTRLVRKYRR
ncbi:hypothetical protein TU94_11755 [Streptomyces cyaneogriseus subsp. noncyanogenus]|uniref:Uncharacterized protein n=1 Tax=Streptomyces cyaneogriseus subsp. noncyanogenus TaxID=477245 RepID=A0A0C5GCX1_9ACTN|nr:hypothetical protein [Streptomyces cyaneogriseus]AJP02071.1 hypothetical protein TU94_11755 [Streptomyces cyaneogriseus subsp. noncyanogenus]